MLERGPVKCSSLDTLRVRVGMKASSCMTAMKTRYSGEETNKEASQHRRTIPDGMPFLPSKTDNFIVYCLMQMKPPSF